MCESYVRAEVIMLQTAEGHKCHLSSLNMKKAYKKISSWMTSC
jgi:hypothetical protein